MSVAAPMWVSDHAVLRWLERVEGIDPDVIRDRIRLAASIGVPDHDGYVHFGKGSLVIEQGKIITVLAIGQRAEKARKIQRRRKRQRQGANA